MQIFIVVTSIIMFLLVGFLLIDGEFFELNCDQSIAEQLQIASENSKIFLGISQIQSHVREGYGEAVSVSADSIEYAIIRPAQNTCIYFAGSAFYLDMKEDFGFQSTFTDIVRHCGRDRYGEKVASIGDAIRTGW